jgi:hypothetical protein
VTRDAESVYNAPMDLDRLAEVSLADADGGVHRLGDYWSERPVALVFLRHFG